MGSFLHMASRNCEGIPPSHPTSPFPSLQTINYCSTLTVHSLDLDEDVAISLVSKNMTVHSPDVGVDEDVPISRSSLSDFENMTVHSPDVGVDEDMPISHSSLSDSQLRFF